MSFFLSTSLLPAHKEQTAEDVKPKVLRVVYTPELVVDTTSPRQPARGRQAGHLPPFLTSRGRVIDGCSGMDSQISVPMATIFAVVRAVSNRRRAKAWPLWCWMTCAEEGLNTRSPTFMAHTYIVHTERQRTHTRYAKPNESTG